MPRAKSDPICKQKYRGKLKRILWIRIFISINQLWMAFLFLLGYACWSLINSRLTLVCSLTNKHELWETLILPPALPRFSEVTSRKKMDGPWVFTCWIQLVSIQSYISHDNNHPFWFLQTNQLAFHSPLYAPLKNSSMRLGEVFCYLKANQIFSHSVTSQIANSAGHRYLLTLEKISVDSQDTIAIWILNNNIMKGRILPDSYLLWSTDFKVLLQWI